MGRVRRRSRRSVVHATLDDLRKRRENVSGSAGLEGRSGNGLEDGLAPLDAECRHDGGSEGALRGRGQGVAHEGGAERGSHGDYGVVRAESGDVVVVVEVCRTSRCNAVCSFKAKRGLKRTWGQPRRDLGHHQSSLNRRAPIGGIRRLVKQVRAPYYPTENEAKSAYSEVDRFDGSYRAACSEVSTRSWTSLSRENEPDDDQRHYSTTTTPSTPSRPPSHTMAMASRRLAMSLNYGLRAQKAIRSLKPSQAGLTRSLATPVHSTTTPSTPTRPPPSQWPWHLAGSR